MLTERMHILLLTILWGCGTTPTPNPPVAEAAPAPPPAPKPPPPPPPISLDVDGSQEELVAWLTEDEQALRDATLPLERVAEHAHRQQRIYRALGKDDALAKAVEAALPEALRTVAERNTRATRAIAKTVRKPRTDLPDWRIVAPPPPDELVALYQKAEEEHGVDWEVLAAIHLCETRMGRLRGVSYAGASGPMQFMPATWDAYGMGGDIHSFEDAIAAAGNYLAKMGFAKDERKAVWHYNHHDAYVDAVLTYASIMKEDPLAYRGYHGWHVYYRTVAGDIWLKEGYESAERQTIAAYCDKAGWPACPEAPKP